MAVASETWSWIWTLTHRTNYRPTPPQGHKKRNRLRKPHKPVVICATAFCFYLVLTLCFESIRPVGYALVGEHLQVTAAGIRIRLGGSSDLRPNLVKFSLRDTKGAQKSGRRRAKNLLASAAKLVGINKK